VLNPLDLPGPTFLVVYTLVALITLILLYVVWAAGESGAPPRIDAGDPYLIAYLRGGKNEALRVATVALIDWGLLQADAATRTVVAHAGVAKPEPPIELALMQHFEQSHLATTVFGNNELAAACGDYERRLTGLGLLPDRMRKTARRRMLMAALVVLVGFSAAKIGVPGARADQHRVPDRPHARRRRGGDDDRDPAVDRPRRGAAGRSAPAVRAPA
jgi:uncharacterized protein (TIGR04222 family)